jgi:hypothetical protein
MVLMKDVQIATAPRDGRVPFTVSSGAMNKVDAPVAAGA